jgi:hypothetical protein
MKYMFHAVGIDAHPWCLQIDGPSLDVGSVNDDSTIHKCGVLDAGAASM